MRTWLGLAALAGAASLLATGPAAAETKLTYSNWLPPTHRIHAEVFQPWIDSVAEVTEGRVVVEVLPKPVGRVPTQFDTGAQGLADIVFIINGYSPGRFDANSVAELPFLGDSAETISVAYQRIYDRHLKDVGEYRGTVPLGVFVHGPGVVYTNDDVMTSVDSLAGKKIRVPSANAIATIEALGGVPILKPVTEVYELMTQGVVDGTVMNRESAKSFNMVPALKNLTIIPGGLYNTTMSLLINENSWNALSEADRTAIMSISGEPLVRAFGRVQDSLDAEGQAALQEGGTKIVTTDPELTAAIRDRIAPVEGIWVEKAEKAGLQNPRAVLEDLRQEIAKEKAAGS